MKIKNLVLSGGGLRGYCYISLLKLIEENPDIFEMDHVAGTSVGAVFSLFIVLGVTYEEISQNLMLKDMSDFQHIKLDNILQFMEKFGLDDGQYFVSFVSYFIRKKGKNPNITFQELYQQTGICLHITGTCLNTREAIYFSHQNYPDMSVLLAVRISISIPFYFIPIYYQNKILVDGGVVDNFPIQLFHQQINDTMGVYLLDNRTTKDEIDSLEDFAYCNFFASTGRKDHKKVNKYRPYCVNIPLNDVGIYSSSLDMETRRSWESISYNILYSYIQNRKMFPPINQISSHDLDNDIHPDTISSIPDETDKIDESNNVNIKNGVNIKNDVNKENGMITVSMTTLRNLIEEALDQKNKEITDTIIQKLDNSSN